MKVSMVLSTGVAVALSAGLAFASTPFGGDDTGFVPPDKAAQHCEDGLAKKVGNLVTGLIKCNIKDSDDQVKHSGAGTFDGAACQGQVTNKWDTTTMAYVCPACIDKNGIRDLTVTLVNLNGSVVFCDNTSGTPQDPPGTGSVPNDKATAKCEDGAAKNAGKLTTAIGKCHVKAADNGFKVKPFDEEACEAAAKTKYDAAAAKLTGCPLCLNHGAVRDLVELLLDSNNGDAYCASPSGAFLN